MNKKPSERKPRPKKKETNSLSASSENINQTPHNQDLFNLVHFYEPFKCKTKTQKDLVNLINDKEIVIASGPAGVGKSFVAIARALELIKANNTPYSKIIISKPAIEADEKHGFIPGDLREKMEPYVASSLDIIDKLIGNANRVKMEELGFIQIQPLAYIRGSSIDKSILIMEEAQNMSPSQIKTLLTRIGFNSKFIISGDLDQSDRYQNVVQSGLYDAIQKHKNIPEIGFVQFSDDEIVRNPIISKILANYKVKEHPKPTISAKIVKKPSLFHRFIKLFK